jgi:hypothetical protein
VKYYVYISDAKVDMLFPQVPHDIQNKVALEFKIDLKLFSASRKSETESENNRIARLEAVVDFIRQYGNVGTVDEPNDYIEDTLAMAWSDRVPCAEGMAYFAGETDKTLVGLGGSVHHIIGNSASEMYATSSSIPAVIEFLFRKKDQNESDESVPHMAKSMRNAMSGIFGPTQELEFLAKRLAYWPSTPEQPNLLLASSLYVAAADNQLPGLGAR